jgi:hypothetical protein
MLTFNIDTNVLSDCFSKYYAIFLPGFRLSFHAQYKSKAPDP